MLVSTTSSPGAIGSEYSVELTSRAVDDTAEGARRLGTAYWQEVRAFSRGLVRPRVGPDGLELVLARVIPLLRFGPAQTRVEDGVVECRYPILGGLLAAGPGGSLVIAQTRRGERLELRLAVEEYHPRLARIRQALYETFQTPLHAGVSRRFLERAKRGPL